MYLPIFPLNTVLFPGMPLKLHIFETRYKTMIRTCIEEQSPFGVVLLERGIQVGQRDVTPHSIGCTAMITQVENLSQGRMNIISIGQERFQIHSLDYESYPYLTADVSLYPLTDSSAYLTQPSLKVLSALVRNYLSILQDAGQIQLENPQIPRNPVVLAYLASAILPLETDQQQHMLSVPDIKTLLPQLLSAYRLELALVDRMKQAAALLDNGYPFSWN